jgi:hypothetical protein
MAGTSKEELQSIYFELADFKARAGQLPEAADCYALALYYARRVGNQPLADLCKEQILACHPNHVAVRENNAPLFFAQLLMRYPAEECSAELQRLKRDRSVASTSTHPEPRFDYAHPAPSMMASHEAPPTIPANPAHPAHFGLPTDIPAAPRMPTGPVDSAGPRAPSTSFPAGGGGVGTLDYPGTTNDSPRGGLAALFGPPTPKRAWSESVSLPLAEPGRSATRPSGAGIGHSGFENHHPFPPMPSPMAMGPAQRMIDDFEAPPHPGQVASPVIAEKNPWAWLEPLAGAVALAGVMAMGFFAYKIAPGIQKIDTKRISQVVDEGFQEAFVWCRSQYERMAPSPAKDRPVEDKVVTESVEWQEGDRLPEYRPLAPISSTDKAESSADPLPEADLAPEPRALPPIPSVSADLPAPASPPAPAGWTAPEPAAKPETVSHLEPVLPPQ